MKLSRNFLEFLLLINIACLWCSWVDAAADDDNNNNDGENPFCQDNKDNYLCKFQETCGKVNKTRSAYITGGEEIQAGEFPFLAQVVNGGRFCSAAIVSDYHIVLAGHCLKGTKNTSRIKVFFGRKLIEIKDGIVISTDYKKVAKYCLHPQLNISDTKDFNDLSVLTLAERLEFNNDIQPVCWPFDKKSIDAGPSSQCFQLGFGFRLDKSSGEYFMPEIARKMRIHEVDCPERKDFITNAACFQGDAESSICHGDSGGPSVCFREDTQQWVMIAVLSVQFEKAFVPTCSGGSIHGSKVPDDILAQTISNQCGPQI